jgi:hypothetical protein
MKVNFWKAFAVLVLVFLCLWLYRSSVTVVLTKDGVVKINKLTGKSYILLTGRDTWFPLQSHGTLPTE